MPAALALFAHPDDIEFRAAGTMLLLAQRGWAIHYCNLCAGNLGSATMSSARAAAVRRREAQAAARVLGARWHPPIARDLELFYTDRAIRQVCAIVRRVQPDIVLTHPPLDYMEDHMNACRLAVTGAFARGMKNYRSIPARPPTLASVALYHAMPHGLCDPLRREWRPDAWVNTAAVQRERLAALACHRSQRAWLDATQKMDSYLAAAADEARELGRRSKKFTHAEGWTRHLHLGFGAAADDPLRDALGGDCVEAR
ncbi:MAG: PIG-L family deacetylase [Verrucomicrobia bacterium]|nr:PIG-L family deacetylase [Verrucomicrobiota bacterium]